MTNGVRRRGDSGDQGSGDGQDAVATPHDCALANICRKQMPFLTRYFLSRGASYDDVQDLIQDTFITFWTRRDGVQPDKAEAFLTGIARNILLAYKRKNHTHGAMVDARLPEITQNIHPAPDTAEDILRAADQLEKLQHLIAQLPPQMARIFRMRHLEGRTHAEIAEALGIAEQSSRALNSRILNDLRASIRRD